MPGPRASVPMRILIRRYSPPIAGPCPYPPPSAAYSPHNDDDAAEISGPVTHHALTGGPLWSVWEGAETQPRCAARISVSFRLGVIAWAARLGHEHLGAGLGHRPILLGLPANLGSGCYIQRRPARLTGPPRLTPRPAPAAGATPTPGAPTPGVAARTAARPAGRATQPIGTPAAVQ